MMNQRSGRNLGTLSLLLSLFLGGLSAIAQPPGVATRAALPTPAVLQQRTKEVASKENLSEAQRTEIVNVYNQALSDLDAQKSLMAKRDQFSELLSQITQEQKKAEKQLGDLKKGPDIETSGKPLNDLMLEVQKKTLESQQAGKDLDRIDDEPERRADRRLEIPRLQVSLASKISDLDSKARDKLPGDSADLVAAKRVLSDIKRANANLQLDALKNEAAYYDASNDLLPIQIEVAKQRVALTEQELKIWQKAAAWKQNSDVGQERAEALQMVENVPDQLKSLAKENVDFVKEWKKLVDEITSTNQSIDKVDHQRIEWDGKFDNSRAMIAAQGGVTATVGEILRNQSRDLPDFRQLKIDRRQTDQQITGLRDQQFQLNERLNQLTDLGQKERTTLDAIVPPISAEERKTLVGPTHKLFAQRIKLLQGIRTVRDNQLQRLLDLALTQDAMLDVVQRYRIFINERVLWIPSSRRVKLSDLGGLAKAFSTLADRHVWESFVVSVPQSLKRKPFPQVLVLLLALSLCWNRWRFAKRIQLLGKRAKAPSCCRFDVSVSVLLMTVARAAVVPLLVVWLSLNLDASTLVLSAEAISHTLRLAAYTYFWLSLWSGLAQPGALCDAHFEWPESLLKLTRRQLRWFTPVVVSCWTIYCFFDDWDPTHERSLGRLAVIIGLLALSFFFYRMFSPHNGILTSHLRRYPTGGMNRFRRLWYPALVILPLVLVFLALGGYTYTAAQLVNRLGDSFYFLGALLLLEAMALRWLRLNRRAIAISQAKERLAESAVGQGKPAEEMPAERTGGVVEGEQVDLVVVSTQTRGLLKQFGTVAALVGLYFIWSDIFPALSKLDEIRFWQTAISQVPVDGNATALADTTTRWITLSDVLGSLIVLFLTFAATKNIPGLLEISVLQRLPLDAALRYAITTVVRYGIIVSGISIAFAYLGFGWERVQWLVAAVSVGLGFGLQEIFANFVSGLILLFERPLRAGDIVTVGDITGKVVQIKMRATTIQDWDRKELVVPNKEFITGNLLNWTLTDSVNRLTVTVGVAYGEDVERTREILLEAASANPNVLDTPPPTVTFDLFADSSLNFSLRVFLPHVDVRLPVTSELHRDIYKRLGEAGIEIPFPQRDLHIRSNDSGRADDTPSEVKTPS
ncbi:MAG: mechanosensitive ion channel [Pirellulaceae bacterium]|nr:mechanosensitive ion channel [Pirellulaceae bacterium]